MSLYQQNEKCRSWDNCTVMMNIDRLFKAHLMDILYCLCFTAYPLKACKGGMTAKG